MSQLSADHPLSLLLNIEHQALQLGRDLPEGESRQQSRWSGLGFRLGKRRWVTPFGELSEILRFPQVTRVPGTLSWVQGVANVRGRLLPVVDLASFLGLSDARRGELSRVLVVNHEGLFVGLLVDEVLGLKHFSGAPEPADPESFPSSLVPYIGGVYVVGGDQWPIFSLHALARNEQFLQAAL